MSDISVDCDESLVTGVMRSGRREDELARADVLSVALSAETTGCCDSDDCDGRLKAV